MGGALPLGDLGYKALGISCDIGKLVRHHLHSHQIGKRRTTMMHAACILVKGEDTIDDSNLWYPSTKTCPFLIAAYFPLSVVGPDGQRYHESKSKATTYCFIQAILAGDAKFVRDELVGRYLRCQEMQRVLFDPSHTKGNKNKPTKQPCAVVTRGKSGSCFFSFMDRNGKCVGPKLVV